MDEIENVDVDSFGEWIQGSMETLTSAVYELASRLLEQGDDRVTVLGMIHSGVMHGLHDAGFTDDTE